MHAPPPQPTVENEEIAVPEESDLPDIGELRTTLSYITARTDPDARTRARDMQTLTTMQAELNETLRRDRPAGYPGADELRVLLDRINNELGDA